MNPDVLHPILAALAGLAVGALVAWLLAQKKAATAATELALEKSRTADLQSDLAELRAQLTARDNQLAERDARIEELSPRLHRAESAAERLAPLEAELRQTQQQLSQLNSANSELRTNLAQEREKMAEKQALLDQAQAKLTDTFKALASEALSKNNASFLELAKSSLAADKEAARGELEKRQQAIAELVQPLREQLARYEQQILGMENARAKAYGELMQQVKALEGSQKALEKQTGSLVSALRAPKTRGRWGEHTLRQVVELAGMVEYCDFNEQASVATEGGRLQPDMIIRLPNGRQIVVDAKAPLDAFLDYHAAEDPAQREEHLARYARAVRGHMDQLGRKSYWAEFDPTPDFVVMFIPGEGFLSAAATVETDLFEHGFRNQVIPATPATLISLLRTVALGWQQEQLARNAREISDLGRELYDRLATMGGHLSSLGNSLEKSVDAYNKTVRSLETRVMVQARKFPELGITDAKKALPEDMPAIELTPLPLNASEFSESDSDPDAQSPL